MGKLSHYQSQIKFPAVHYCHGCVRWDFRADAVRGTERCEGDVGLVIYSLMFLLFGVSGLETFHMSRLQT